jgi:hypothetical protein
MKKPKPSRTGLKFIAAAITWNIALVGGALTFAAYGEGGGVLSVLRNEPTHWSDRKAEPEAVDASRVELAGAVVSATDEPSEQAALTALAIHESRLALYVLEGRCSDGPKGACDHGLAVGPWQLHRSKDEPVIPAELGAQARIALKRWRTHRKRCAAHGLAGAFQGYGSGWTCAPKKWARDRVPTLLRIEAKLWSGVPRG